MYVIVCIVASLYRLHMPMADSGTTTTVNYFILKIILHIASQQVIGKNT